MKIKTATGPIKLYMNLCGFKGWASFWNTIYVMPGYEHASWLIRHEAKHLEQIAREGKLQFAVKYIGYLLRYGYQKSPYEVEARQAENLNG